MTEHAAGGRRVYDPLTRRQFTRTQTSLYQAAIAAPFVRVWRQLGDAGAVMVPGADRTWRRQTFNAMAHLFVKLELLRPTPAAPAFAVDYRLRADLRGSSN